MRQYYCPECGQAISISGNGTAHRAECPGCNQVVSVRAAAPPRGGAALLPGAQFLRGRSYGWYSTLVKGRRG